MSTSYRVSSLIVTAVIALSALFALDVRAQNHYVLNPPQPLENDGKIEVLEWFAYGCIHCARLESTFSTWAKTQPADVKVRRVPSTARLLGIDSATLFYTLEAMGEVNRLHAKIFAAAHEERVMLGHTPTLLKWLEKNGVDPKKYEDVSRSFSIVSRVARAQRMLESYKIEVTPTMVIQGRLGFFPAAEGPEKFLQNVNDAIAEFRLREAGANTKAPPTKAPDAKSPNAPAKK
jgi:protein dithiol oxidoreductase (disulfide-forming)